MIAELKDVQAAGVVAAPSENAAKDKSRAADGVGSWAVVNRVADLLAPPKEKKRDTPRKRRPKRKPEPRKKDTPPPAASTYVPGSGSVSRDRTVKVITYERPRRGFD